MYKKIDKFQIALNFAKQLGLPSFLSIQITWVLLMYNERKILIFKIRGGVVFLSRFKIAYAVVVFKISENLVEFKPFETLDKRLFFRKNQLRACLIYTVHNVCKLFDA